MNNTKVVCSNRLLPPRHRPRNLLKILSDLEILGFRGIQRVQCVFKDGQTMYSPTQSITHVITTYDPYHGNIWMGEYRVKGDMIFQVILEYIYTNRMTTSGGEIRWVNFKHGPHKIVRRFARVRR